MTQTDIGRLLNRGQNTISEYVSDIVRARLASEKSLTMRLVRLGWTQEEIAKVVGKARSRIAQIVNYIDSDIINNFEKAGKASKVVIENQHQSHTMLP